MAADPVDGSIQLVLPDGTTRGATGFDLVGRAVFKALEGLAVDDINCAREEINAEQFKAHTQPQSLHEEPARSDQRMLHFHGEIAAAQQVSLLAVLEM